MRLWAGVVDIMSYARRLADRPNIVGREGYDNDIVTLHGCHTPPMHSQTCSRLSITLTCRTGNAAIDTPTRAVAWSAGAGDTWRHERITRPPDRWRGKEAPALLKEGTMKGQKTRPPVTVTVMVA